MYNLKHNKIFNKEISTRWKLLKDIWYVNSKNTALYGWRWINICTFITKKANIFKQLS
jgi:hypothetical protein